jgi:oligoendopeptidase F
MHESDHALHRRLFAEQAQTHLQGPALSEVVALFGEILLADHLATTATKPSDAILWRRQFLSKILEVFYGAKDAELEQTIYDSVSAGGAATADDFDCITRRVDSAYSIERRISGGPEAGAGIA